MGLLLIRNIKIKKKQQKLKIENMTFITTAYYILYILYLILSYSSYK